MKAPGGSPAEKYPRGRVFFIDRTTGAIYLSIVD